MNSRSLPSARQTHARFLNVTMLFLHNCGDPFVEDSVNVIVLNGSTTRTLRLKCNLNNTDTIPTLDIGWLLLEFPHRREEDLPFVTISMEPHSRLLVFSLPVNFSFAVSEVSSDYVT